MNQLLVLSQDPHWRQRLREAALASGVHAVGGADWPAACSRTAPAPVGVGILDWGTEAAGARAERFRRDFPGWYLIFAVPAHGLSAADVAAALAAGADGVIDQDLTGPRLSAQLRVLLRRCSASSRSHGALSADGDMRLDMVRYEVSFKRRGKWGPGRGLGRKEAALLLVFLSHPGRVLERGILLTKVWGQRAGQVNAEALDKQVAGLRRKLGARARRLRTVRGRGYVMI